ncbi:MAG: metal ABC transporter solute-binding protein, Zn/Mn family [Janthinobacterium lividum]
MKNAFLKAALALATTCGLLGSAHAAPASAAHASDHPISIVAAENFYADVAKEIGGAHVSTSSILSNPDEDPHLFEASPSVARRLSAARLVVYNGAGYDAWMSKLLSASQRAGRQEIVAAQLVGKHDGDNPHLWYLPATMPAVAAAIRDALSQIDPANRDDYARRYTAFVASLTPLQTKIAQLNHAYRSTPVTATEPVFGYMADAIGLTMRNARFQQSIMNDTEPVASDIAAFENDLRTRQVQALLFNKQTNGPLTTRLLKLAQSAGVPAVAVTETQPPGLSYVQWMMSQLDALERALGRAK